MVEHDKQHKRFVVALDDDTAVLQYVLRDTTDGEQQVIDFTHTFVPPSFRGKGIAEQLVRTGLIWAKKQGYQIVASCWYVDKFLRKP